MQPFISQALLATRTAEMHREAQIAQRARGLKRARRARTQVRPATPPALSSANAQRTRSKYAACAPNRVAHAGRTDV
jgi:hypothetical protein